MTEETGKASGYSRRTFLQRTGAAAAWLAAPDPMKSVDRIRDPEIRAGVRAAIEKNMLPAAVETLYPGHFYISADGGAYGGDATWPGLDSWQMACAYLKLGRTRLVTDYFDFVRASQRKDGNIPFAIFGGETRGGDGCLRGLKYPDDVFTYKPPVRDGVPASSQETRSWIGLFAHWQTLGDPLSTLGPICYVLTANEIYATTRSAAWLTQSLPSVIAAAEHVASRIGPDGLVSGSGFYTEAPPRYRWDGVTQCYSIHALRQMALLCRAAGRKKEANGWSTRAAELVKAFHVAFWREDHYGEYVHPERGLVDAHGLSDVNWAAVGLGVASGSTLQKVARRVLTEEGFWVGAMPTQTVTKPHAYEEWESAFYAPCPCPPLNDVAAMGRAWRLEALACVRVHAHDRLIELTRLVCRAAKADGFWRERYHANEDGTVSPAGASKYCEYAAVLVSVVLGNPRVFQA